METPHLVAPGVRSFMDLALKNCNKMKDAYMTTAVNLGLTALFVLVVGSFLYYKYKGKPTPAELDEKRRQGHEYVMRKLGTHVATKQMAATAPSHNNASVITGLPIWEKSLLIPG